MDGQDGCDGERDGIEPSRVVEEAGGSQEQLPGIWVNLRAPCLVATRCVSVAITLSVRSGSRQSSQRRGTAQVIDIVIMV
jgi:hypothetical protein